MNRKLLGMLIGALLTAAPIRGGEEPALLFEKGLSPLRILRTEDGSKDEPAVPAPVPLLRNLTPVRIHSSLPPARKQAEKGSDVSARPVVKTDSAPTGPGIHLTVSRAPAIAKTLDVGRPDRVAGRLLDDGAEWFYPARDIRERTVEPALPRTLLAVDGPESIRFKVEVRLTIPALPTGDNLEAARLVLEDRLLERYKGHPRYSEMVDKVALLGGLLRYSFDGRSVFAEFEQLVYDSRGNRIPTLEREYFVVTFDQTARI